MAGPAPAPADQALAERRRGQILDAAAGCFRRSGFHATSMAQIAQSFGMSAGHIYNYFDSKEAIIAAIVERDLDELLAFFAALRGDPDVGRSMVDRCMERLDDDALALKIEVLAEAAHNPKVAEMVTCADAVAREQVVDLIRAAHPAGTAMPNAELQGRAAMMIAFFEGLQVRLLRHPKLDRAGVQRELQRAVTHLLSD